MSISKEQKIMELVERQLDLLTVTEALNIAGGFFTELLETMNDGEIDELYNDMGAGRHGLH